MSNTRLKMWKQRFAKSSTTAKFLSTLPPTTEAFTQNVLRAHLQTYIWKFSLQRNPVKPDPLDYGFKTNEITKTSSNINTRKHLTPSRSIVKIDKVFMRTRRVLQKCTMWLLQSTSTVYTVLQL